MGTQTEDQVFYTPHELAPPPSLRPTASVFTPNPFQALTSMETDPDPPLMESTSDVFPKTKTKLKKRARSSPSSKSPPLLEGVTLSPLGSDSQNGYYMPGQLQGQKLAFLIDTGCTTTVLALDMFKRLPAATRQQLEQVPGSARTANGQAVITHGYITLKGRLRHQPIQQRFLIAEITEDAILGMDFLQDNEAILNFKTAELGLGKHRLTCVSRQGLPLMARLYLPHGVQVPARSEMVVIAKLQTPLAHQTVVTAALSQERPYLTGGSVSMIKNQTTPLRILNPQAEALSLPAGKVVGMATSTLAEEINATTDRDTEYLRRLEPGNEPQIPPHLQELWEQAMDKKPPPLVQSKLKHLLCNYANVFSTSDVDVGRTDQVKHSIPTQPGSRPVKQRARRLGPEKEKEVDRQVKELVENEFIEPGSGAWSSPVVLVKKKDGSWRFCVDYRKLNELTIKDAYPLPRIDESLDALSGSRYFSTLDLTSGYWQVELDDEARDKAAFVTRNGLWRWKVLPFGLTSAPSTFERLMEKILRGLHWKTVLIYLDDIVIFSESMEQHIDRLEEVLARLQQAGLKLKPRKCELLKSSVKYLGHVVSADGVATDPDKISAIRDWPTPTNLTELRSFLGATGYYRRFVPQYARLAQPLTKLLSKGVSFSWDEKADQAFHLLRQGLVEAPILGYPDPRLSYIVDTDASDYAMGAVLSQVQDTIERPVAYYSKTFSSEERNYCVTRRELLAVVKALHHFRPYLYGQKFTLRTDHESLRWMTNIKEPRGQVARWLEAIQEFSFTTLHRRGASHGNADALSRRPCTEDCKSCMKQDPGLTEPAVAETGSSPAIDSTHVVARVQGGSTVVHCQQTEEPVARIYRAVRAQEPPEATEKQEASPELKRWIHNFDHLTLREDGVLQIRLQRNIRGVIATVAPPSLRNSLIKEVHHANHLGEWKTYQKLLLNWYWPGMQADVRRMVRNCEICQQQKNHHQPQGQTRRRLYAGRPWQRLAIDFTGPLDKTPRGNQWILVITDHFTRWCDAFPMPDATAEATAKILEERVFCHFGVPEIIHSDQGRQFQSNLFSELCKIWGCEKTQTTPYRPQANGLCERLNRTLGDALRTMLAETASPITDWDLLLPQLMRSIRSVPHTATGETANYLMLGREVRLPASLLHEITSHETQSADSYALQLQNRLKKAHELLRNKQLQNRVEDSEEPPLFKIGDLVWLKSHQRRKGMAQARKLQPKFIGPYKIIEALPYHTYRLSRDGKETVEHEGRIKLHIYAGSAEERMMLPPPPKIPKQQASRVPLPGPSDFPAVTYIPDQAREYEDHQLEIESLPNQTPRHYPEIEDYPIPLAITDTPPTPAPEVAEVAQNLPTPSTSEERATLPSDMDERGRNYREEFPTINETAAVPGRRNPSRQRKLPSRYTDYDITLQNLAMAEMR